MCWGLLLKAEFNLRNWAIRLTAQLIEHCTSIAEVMGWNTVHSYIICTHNCGDHSSNVSEYYNKDHTYTNIYAMHVYWIMWLILQMVPVYVGSICYCVSVHTGMQIILLCYKQHPTHMVLSILSKNVILSSKMGTNSNETFLKNCWNSKKRNTQLKILEIPSGKSNRMEIPIRTS